MKMKGNQPPVLIQSIAKQFLKVTGELLQLFGQLFTAPKYISSLSYKR